MTDEEERDVIYFFLYFFCTCFGIVFIIFLLFLCFSGRICIFIYYKVICNSRQYTPLENTPLIVESEYFPRPGYDGYCLLGQEDHHLLPDQEESNGVVVIEEGGLLLSHSIDITHGAHQVQGRPTPGSGNFPRGILTPKEKRRREGRKSRQEDSLKSVSFNPKTEFQLL